MKIGLEIEADRGSFEDAEYGIRCATRRGLPFAIDVTTDGSLSSDGIEVKPGGGLAPQHIAEFTDVVVAELKDAGYEATGRCGLHVHLDRNGMSLAVQTELAAAMMAWCYTAVYDEDRVTPALFGTTRDRMYSGRSGNCWAEAPTKPEHVALLLKLGVRRLKSYRHTYGSHEDRANFYAASYVWNHYSAVSFSTHHETIEFRMAAGTLCPARIKRIVRRLRTALALVRTGVLAKEIRAVRNANDEFTGVGTVRRAVVNLGVALEEAVLRVERKRLSDARKVTRATKAAVTTAPVTAVVVGVPMYASASVVGPHRATLFNIPLGYDYKFADGSAESMVFA